MGTTQKTGTTTITYKIRLYDRHQSWMIETIEVYRLVAEFYYRYLAEHPELLLLGNFELLRELEIRTIGSRNKKGQGEPEALAEPGESEENEKNGNLLQEFLGTRGGKIPLYFRRSAINQVIGAVKSERSRGDAILAEVAVQRVAELAPILYQGMYRNLSEQSVELKLYHDGKWHWVVYPYHGRRIGANEKVLSPRLCRKGKDLWLHVPVEKTVEDIRTVQERMQQEKRICSVAFPDGDVLAVCAVLDKAGKLCSSRHIRGGKEREEKRRQVLSKLEKSRESRKKQQSSENQTTEKTKEQTKEQIEERTKKQTIEQRENARYFQELSTINEFYVENVCNEILNFCRNEEIKVIVVPNYGAGIDFSDKRYLTTGKYRWQGRAIIHRLGEKAFQNGIVVTKIRPIHITDRCSECGMPIRRYNEGHAAGKNYYGGRLFLCENGHKGSTGINTAKNIGRYFLDLYGKNFQRE